MIPSLIDIGNPAPWRVLPPGIHVATLDEIEKTYCYTPHRTRLFRGFCQATKNLENAGCRVIYLDGSFTTEKDHPEDFDACWDLAGVDPYKLDPTLLDFTYKRAAQKAKYGGELFIANFDAAPGIIFLDFFQIEKYTGKNKGILMINLTGNIVP